MRVECERCHALVVADFDVDPDGVTVACGACGSTFRAEARRRPAAPVVPAAAEAAACVKCGAPATSAPACPRCGLVRERAPAFTASDSPPADELIAAWTAAEASWDDPAAHDRAAAVALSHGALPWLARRYRETQRARPTDAVARARIDRIALMTVAALQATATVPVASRGGGRSTLLVLLLIGLVVAGTLLAARASSSKRSGSRRPAIPGERGTKIHRDAGAPSIEPARTGR